MTGPTGASVIRRATIHNQHRRSFSHDYRAVGTYMLTMVVEGRKRVFGRIEGTSKGKAGTNEMPHMVLSELGRQVVEVEIQKIHHFYPMAEVWRVAMMPDHIHLLIRVGEPLPEGKHLGTIVRGFKTGCTRAWWRLEKHSSKPRGETLGTTASPSSAAVPEASPSGLLPVLFEAGYHDRIINRPGMLENIKRYMAENPLRFRIREECPKLMERQLHLWIDGREYAAFGNLFLLKYPLKEQVFFHRKDRATGQPTETTAAFQQERSRLLRIAEEGVVLVTPGISKGESLVVDDALKAQLSLILLQKEPITHYWKPSQRRFYACCTGRLLILAPWQLDETSDYGRFHRLNDLANEICKATEMRIMNYNVLVSSQAPSN